MNWETGTFDTSYLSNNYCYFELIEDNTIDIDSIEEFEIAGCNVKFNDTFISTESLINDMTLDKINQIIQAVKQLNKELKEK